MPQRPGQQRNSQRKLAEIRRQQRARQTRLRVLAGGAALAAIAVAVLAVVAFTGGQTTAQRIRGMATGATVDGIACQASEQVDYHIHSHLAIYASGARQAVPAGIGIPGPQQVVAASSRAASACTGCTPMTPRASSMSNPPFSASTRSGSSSTYGGSR
jgi:hypothetical protein